MNNGDPFLPLPISASVTRNGSASQVTYTYADGSSGRILVNGVVNGGDITGAGPVSITGGAAADVILGLGVSGGTLNGAGGDDTLTGAPAADTLVGGDGADRMTGGGGADVFLYTAASDSRTGGQDTITDFQTGTDVIDLTAVSAQAVSIVRTGTATFIFANTPGGAMVIGSEREVNANDLRGLNVGVYTVGSSNPEFLRSGANGDVLQGGGGGDTMFAGAGADRFTYGAISDSTLARPDTISGFQSGVDKLDLTGLRTGGTAARTGILSQSGATFVFVDVGADGTTDMLIQLTNLPSFTSADILV